MLAARSRHGSTVITRRRGGSRHDQNRTCSPPQDPASSAPRLHPPRRGGMARADDEQVDLITERKEYVGWHAHLDFEVRGHAGARYDGTIALERLGELSISDRVSLEHDLVGFQAARHSVIDRPTHLERRAGCGRHRYGKVKRCLRPGGIVISDADPVEPALGVLPEARRCDRKGTLKVPEQFAGASPEPDTLRVGISSRTHDEQVAVLVPDHAAQPAPHQYVRLKP
jgi:hypothetical protein